MAAIFPIVLPLFVLLGAGFLSGRFQNAAAGPMTEGLSRFLGTYALPALLFSSMAKADIPSHIEWGFVSAFFLAAFAIFALGALWMISMRRPSELASVGFAASFSNIGMIGAPIIMDAYGPSVAVPVMLLIVFQSPLLFTAATLVAECQRATGGRPLDAAWIGVKASLISPITVAIGAGLMINLLRLPVPASAMKAADLVAQTVLPCACFTAGATLARLANAVGGVGARPVLQASIMTVLKTVAHPVLTWLLAVKVFALSPVWIAAAVTAAALPVGINACAFAARYDSGREAVSLSMLISTLVSPFTISLAFLAAMA